MSSDKLTINRKVLEEHGIFFSEDVYSPRNTNINKKVMFQVPEHVENIIEALLEHDIRIPDSLQSLFEKEQQITNAEYTVFPPTKAFFSIPHDSIRPMGRENKAIEEKFEKVASLARIAREYDAAKVSQETWKHFLRSYIFRGFEDSAVHTSRHSKLFDAWTLESNISWKAAAMPNQISGDVLQPSFTYGFPVLVPDDAEKTPPTGFSRNECVTNFSLNTLADLGSIVACPTINLSTLKTRMTDGQKPERKDLICFPWALVEAQSATETAEECYCRAAIGAHAALNMLGQLQPVWAVAKDIPLIIFFTCSGPEIRMWLSFSEFKVSKSVIRCICIWAGTLTATWCIVVLREIIQNMTFWATRVLKPQIASRISRIRFTVSQNRPYPHGTIQFRETASQEPQVSEDTNISKIEKPISSIQGGSLFSEQSFKWSFDALVKTEKLHTKYTNIPKTEEPTLNIQRGLLSSEQKPSNFKSSDTTVKIKNAKYWYQGKRILIRMPSHDERKPRRVTKADWDANLYLWRTARRAMVSGQMALGDEQNTRGGDESVAENSGAQQILQTGKSNKVEGNKEVDGRPVSQENAPDGSSGELEESKKNPALNAETQDINTGPSHASKDQSLDKSNAEVDGSGDVDVESFGEYFAYRTKESFHARSYDAAIWDSDGENDKSYYTPTLGSEPDSEGSDDADDEGSECTSSHDYDYASTEELLSELKNENQRADSPGLLTRNPSGQVRNLTLDDVNDLLYTAVNVISGEDFIQLRPIKTLLENLNEVELLDATWRSLENWEGQSPNLYSRQMRFLLATVQNLNNFLASESDDLISLFAHHHLTMALRKDDLDQTLQRMQKKGDWRLRDLLKSLLKSWDGEKCMELLSNELLELAPEEFDSMLQEAFDVVHSDSNLLGTVR